MSSLNEIRTHIESVKITRQITNAMYLISTSRVQKVMSHIEYNKIYHRKVREAMKNILQEYSGVADNKFFEQPSLDKNKVTKIMYIVIAGDKGLCGNYNNAVLNLAWQTIQYHVFDESSTLLTTGLMAREYFLRKGVVPTIELTGIIQDPKLSFAREISDDILKYYSDGLVSEVYLIYTHYYSSAKQEARVQHLLPLKIEDFEDVEVDECYSGDIIVEPSPNQVFDYLVPQYVTGLLHQALTMCYASENSSRMMAMQTATKNADEMLTNLNLQYNTKRQSKITSEITEIAASSQRERT